ncbi:hypothetical protein WKU26_01535 [Phocaeicola sp. HCN-40430]|uniref:SecDF P1 head subdomain-containing protein n=1 Tax=Phocaeicola sp. HCN-40430 TaxID=3134664 RepID=UPI0030BED0AD
MRKKIYFSLLVLISSLFVIAGCDNKERENGWYYVSDNNSKELSDTPFMTTDDISGVSLETDNSGNIFIMLKLKKEGIKKLEKATGLSKGKYIAFFYDGTIISMPLVNEKISSEFMQITNSDSSLLENVYNSLKEQL